MRRSELLLVVAPLTAALALADPAPAPTPAPKPGAAPADANTFVVQDMGLRIVKPTPWSFIPLDEATASRIGFLLEGAGPEDQKPGSSERILATRDALARSATICKINRWPSNPDLKEPNPGVAVTIQSFLGVDEIPDVKAFAIAGGKPEVLEKVYHDIQYVDYLVPTTIGEIAGLRSRFTAKVTEKIYKGTLEIEQLFVMQGRLGICFTFSDSESNWKKSEGDFLAMQRSIALPRVPPPPAPPEEHTEP
ncbi:MAG: hypothetical protein U0166_29105 [Acidobacteriota bacterium]